MLANIPKNPLNIKTTATFSNNKEDQLKDARALCTQNYSPCVCTLDANGNIYISCEANLCFEDQILEIQKVFRRTTDTEIFEVQIMFTNRCSTYFPADFLGDKLINHLLIGNELPLTGPGPNDNYVKLTIDPLAFQSTRSYTTQLYFKNIDFFEQLDFGFLNGFDNLQSIIILDYHNLPLQYLPPLASLTSLYINNCERYAGNGSSAVCEFNFPDLTPAKLEYLSLFETYLKDESANQIVASLASSSSAFFIQYIDMGVNNLTALPNNIASFPTLNHLDLQENSITFIPSGSLVFTSPVVQLNLRGQTFGIDNTLTIETGAFQGTAN